MRIYVLDLHYVLCRPCMFVLMLTNKTEWWKILFTPTIPSKKYQPSLFQYIVVIISLKFFLKQLLLWILMQSYTQFTEIFVRASYLKKMYLYVFMSENA